LKVEKLLIKKIAETLNDCFVIIAENVKRKSKNDLISDDNNSTDNHTLFCGKKLK